MSDLIYVVEECLDAGEYDREADWHVSYAGTSAEDACKAATPRTHIAHMGMDIRVTVWRDGQRLMSTGTDMFVKSAGAFAGTVVKMLRAASAATGIPPTDVR